MPTGVLITNNSNIHPPETWAMATASMIIDVNQGSTSVASIEALRLQASIAEVLTAHYSALMETERKAMEVGQSYEAKHEVGEAVDAAVADIAKAAKGTAWGFHFSSEEAVPIIEQLIENHMISAQHVERQAHARVNHSEAATAFLNKLHGEGT